MSFLTPRYLNTFGRCNHFEPTDIAMMLNVSFDVYRTWALDEPLPVSVVWRACTCLGLPPRLFLTEEEYATLAPPAILFNGKPLKGAAAATATALFHTLFADNPRDHRFDVSLQAAATTPPIRKKSPVRER
jgi:hypothetical protein